MAVRYFFCWVLFLNSLAVSVALMLYHYTGENHFEEGRFITLFSTFQLLTISGLSYRILQIRKVERRQSLWRAPSTVWGIISLGFLFLAADDFFKIHENIDRLIHTLFNLQETGLTDRIDDGLIGLYALVGIGVLIIYRNELKTYRKALPFFSSGFILLFITIALDLLTNRNDIFPLFFGPTQAAALYVWLSHAENSLQVFAEAFFIGAFYTIWQTAKTMTLTKSKDSVLHNQATSV